MLHRILPALVALLARPPFLGSAAGQMLDYEVVAMSGAQVVPPNASAATGQAYTFLNTTTRELSWTLVFQGLTGNQTAAHIHGPAAAGANAPVLIALGHGSGTTGSKLLTVQQVAQFQLNTPVKPWVGLGYAVTGSNNQIPRLVGTGPLTANSANALTLSNAKPNAPSVLFVGLTAAYLPFKGGAIVPNPQFSFTLPVSAQGGWSLPFHWPAGVPLYTNFYVHAWIKDAGGTKGFAASGSLRGTAG